MLGAGCRRPADPRLRRSRSPGRDRGRAVVSPLQHLRGLGGGRGHGDEDPALTFVLPPTQSDGSDGRAASRAPARRQGPTSSTGGRPRSSGRTMSSSARSRRRSGLRRRGSATPLPNAAGQRGWTSAEHLRRSRRSRQRSRSRRSRRGRLTWRRLSRSVTPAHRAAQAGARAAYTNFLLVRHVRAQELYEALLARGLAIRPSPGALRITVHEPEADDVLLEALAALT